MGVVLVAFDGTDSASKAVDHARVLLADADSMVLLLVLPPGGSGSGAAVICPEEPMGWEDANLLVSSAASELVRNHAIQAVGVVRRGEPGPTIVAAAEEMGASVVVVGVGRLERISCFALGSVADHVARHCRVPVLIVR
jgi:nucleotide-binding universal stress UspA family protein